MKKSRKPESPAMKQIIWMARMHRLLPMFFIILPLLFSREKYLLVLGAGLIAYAVYTYLGYVCQWKHIYCSYQQAYHMKMTPHRIRWSTIKKSDGYGIPMIFAVLGILCMLAHHFNW